MEMEGAEGRGEVMVDIGGVVEVKGELGLVAF